MTMNKNGVSEELIEEVAKSVSEAEDGDAWELQPSYYRRNARRRVRAVIAAWNRRAPAVVTEDKPAGKSYATADADLRKQAELLVHSFGDDLGLLEDAIVSALQRERDAASPAPSIPAGYRLVPEEPTEEMKVAAFGPILLGGRGGPITKDFIRQEVGIATYKAMLAAAPSFGADYPGGALSTEQSTLHPLADREKSAAPAQQQEGMKNETIRSSLWSTVGQICGVALRRLI